MTAEWRGGAWSMPSAAFRNGGCPLVNPWEQALQESTGQTHDSVAADDISLVISLLGASRPQFEVIVSSWHDLEEQLAQCGIPAAEQHPHNFDKRSSSIRSFTCKTVEFVEHELWLLLEMLPKEIRPKQHLDSLIEIKLRLGQVPQIRLRSNGCRSELVDVDTQDSIKVTVDMLDSIAGHPYMAPDRYKFHQGRAGVSESIKNEVRPTLHRITGVWGPVQKSMLTKRAEDVFICAAMEIGKSFDEVRPYIQTVVEENWYETVESLQWITAAEWKSMNVPGCFVHAVQNQLARFSKSGTPNGNPQQLIGLNLRVGRAAYGLCDHLEDILQTCSSTLLIGQAGVGKTTILREMTRLLSDMMHQCVVVVDTTSELGGFGPIPHQALGIRDVTRLYVPTRSDLFQVMLDAVQNHSARVVVVDELRDSDEIAAATTIANQGVVLLATVHGTSLSQLARNPTLNPLIGGVDSAIIGDVKMKETHSQTKFLECLKGKPAFQTVLEIRDSGHWTHYPDVANAVTELLNGREAGGIDVSPTRAGHSTNYEGTSDITVEVQRAGVSKVPAHLFAKLCSGTAYLCCFDGGVSWSIGSDDLNPAGASSCMFRIHSNGRKNTHMHEFDRTVFLQDATVDQAEYAGLFAAVLTFAEFHSTLTRPAGLLLIDGDNRIIIEDVQATLEDPSSTFIPNNDPSLKRVLEKLLSALRGIEHAGVKVYLRHRPRRFNKVADRLTKLPRQQKSGNFNHALLEELVTCRSRKYAGLYTSPPTSYEKVKSRNKITTHDNRAESRAALARSIAKPMARGAFSETT